MSVGGLQYDSGTALGAVVRGVVQNISGFQVVIAGGTVSSTRVSSGGNLYVSGTAVGAPCCRRAPTG